MQVAGPRQKGAAPRGHPAAPLLQRSRHHLKKEIWCGGCTVAPFCPSRHGGKAQMHLAQEGCPVNGIERVDKIQTQCREEWTTASAPSGTATPTCKGDSQSRASDLTCEHKHLATRRRNVSPTAIGRTSVVPFGKACRVAPARCCASSNGASPRAHFVPIEHCPKLHADVHRGGRLDRPRCPDGNCEPLEPHRQRQKY